MPLRRTRVQPPPSGWRKPIPARIKLDVVIRQDGRCAVTGERLGTLAETEFDHRPPIADREYDADADDTIPPANDPAHIFATRKAPHKGLSSADATKRAKAKRLRAAQDDFEDAALDRQCGQKRTPRGTIRSRNTLRKREDQTT